VSARPGAVRPSRPQCVVAEEQWEEARHELQKRVAAIVSQGRLSSEQGEQLLAVVHDFVEHDVIEVVPGTSMSTWSVRRADGCPRTPTTGHPWHLPSPSTLRS
jgi:hypothetical protein